MKNSKASSSKSRAQVAAMTASNSSIVGGSVSELFAAFQDTSGCSTPTPKVDLGILNSMRLLNKKDNQTRSKFLQNYISTILPMSAKEEVIGILPHFVQYYVRGALLDPDWKCRSLYHKSLGSMYGIVGRLIESHLPSLYPVLMVGMFEDSEVGLSARDALELIFPSVDRRNRAMVHFVDRLLDFVVLNFDSTPAMLSTRFRNATMEADESFELMDRWNRVETASIRLVEFLGRNNIGWDRVLETNPARFLVDSETGSTAVSLATVKFLLNLCETSYATEFFQNFKIWHLVENLFKNTAILLDGTSSSSVWLLLDRLPQYVDPSIVGNMSKKLEIFIDSVEDPRSLGVSFWNMIPKFFPSDERFSDILIAKVLPVYLNETRSYNEARIGAFFETLFFETKKIRPIFAHFTGRPHEWKLRSAAVHALLKVPHRSLLDTLTVDDVGVPSFVVLTEKNGDLKILDWNAIEFLLDFSCSFDIYCLIMDSPLFGLSANASCVPVVGRLLTRLQSFQDRALFDRLVRWVYDLKNLEFSLTLFVETKIGPLPNYAVSCPAEFVEDLISDLGEILKPVMLEAVNIGLFEIDAMEPLLENILLTKKLGQFRSDLLLALVEAGHGSQGFVKFAWTCYCQEDASLDIGCLVDVMRENEWAKNLYANSFIKGEMSISMKIFYSLFQNNPDWVCNWMLKTETKFNSRHDDMFGFLRKSNLFWNLFFSSPDVFTDITSLQFLSNEETVSIAEAANILSSITLNDSCKLVPLLDRMFGGRCKSADDVTEAMDAIVLGLSKNICLGNLFLLKFIASHFHLSVATSRATIDTLLCHRSDSVSCKNTISAILVVLDDCSVNENIVLPDKTESIWLNRFNEENFATVMKQRVASVDLTFIDSTPVAEFVCRTGDVEGPFSRYLLTKLPVENVKPNVLAALAEHGSVEWAVSCLEHADDIWLAKLGLNRITLILTCNDFLTNKLILTRLMNFTNDFVTVAIWRIFLEKFVNTFSYLGDYFEENQVPMLKDNLFRLGELCLDSIQKAENDEWKNLLELILRSISPIDAHTWSSTTLSLAGEKICVESKLSDRLIESEIQTNRFRHENLKQNFSLSSKQLICRYSSHGGEISAELRVQFPASWPLRLGIVEVSPVVGLSKAKNSRLQISIQNVFKMNGVQNAIQIWTENIEGFLANVEECYICYSVTYHHGTKGTGTGTGTGGSIPNKECKTCKYKFHSECLLKWFKSSSKSNCPLCTNPF